LLAVQKERTGEPNSCARPEPEQTGRVPRRTANKCHTPKTDLHAVFYAPGADPSNLWVPPRENRPERRFWASTFTAQTADDRCAPSWVPREKGGGREHGGVLVRGRW